MSHPEKTMFVCTNQRPPGAKESCGPRESDEFLQRVRECLRQKMLWGQMRAIASGCLGACENGPWAVVYPDDIWYRGFTVDDAEEIVTEHLQNGRPVERLRFTPKPDSPGGLEV
jgi:(2Fe-2S) ferredoxin